MHTEEACIWEDAGQSSLGDGYGSVGYGGEANHAVQYSGLEHGGEEGLEQVCWLWDSHKSKADMEIIWGLVDDGSRGFST